MADSGMTRCQPRLLSPFLDGELDASIHKQVEAHLRGCPSCGAILDEVITASEQVRSMGRATIPAAALEPAVELFAERAGIGEYADPIADTVVVAREPEPENGQGEADAEGTPESQEAAQVEPDVEPEAELPTEPEAEEPSEPTDEVDVEATDEVDLEATDEVDVEATDEVDLEAQPVADPIPDALPPVEAPAQPRGGVPSIPKDWQLKPPPEPWPTVWQPETATPAPVPSETADVETGADAPEAAEEEAEIEAPAAEKGAADIGVDALVEGDEAAGVVPALPVGPMETSATGWIDGEHPMPESEAALARLRGALARLRGDQKATPAIAVEDEEPEPPGEDRSPDAIHAYRQALVRESREPGEGIALPLIGTRVSPRKMMIGAAIAAVLVMAAGVGVVMAFSRAPATTASTHSQPSATPSASSKPSASAVPSTAPSTAPAALVPQLTGVVSAGSGGTGYKVLRLRTGTPAAGIFRLVLDMDGSGAAPSANLGRGPDGALYLTGTGVSIDPGMVQGFSAAGPLTGITQVTPTGLSLKLSTSGAPQFGMGYLNSPTRLVIDFQ